MFVAAQNRVASWEKFVVAITTALEGLGFSFWLRDKRLPTCQKGLAAFGRTFVSVNKSF